MARAISHEQTAAATGIQRLLVPSVTDIVFVLLAFLAPLGKAREMLNSDGDLARHLRVGNYILDHHGLFHHDFLSFTVYGKAFVPYEWLSEVIFALANRAGGLPAVVILTGLVIASTYALVTHFLRSRGVDPLLALGAGLFAALISEIHWLARPHIFTSLATIMLLLLLERSERRWRDLWRFAALFVVWTNLHGGFLFGLVLLAVYVAGDLAEYRWGERSRDWLLRARWHGAGLATALVACCVNPSGLLLFGHVTGYFGQSLLVNTTEEYMSPNFHDVGPKLFLIALLLIIAGLALPRRRPTFPRLLTLLVTVAFALVSARNIPLFAVSAMPLMVLELAPLWKRTEGALARFQSSFALGDRVAMGGLWAGTAAILIAGLALNHGSALGSDVTHAQFDPAIFPVAAVADARSAGLNGRIFNEFSWGGYILYAWPEEKVFIDGQTDLYGEAVARDFLTVWDLEPGWRDVLDRWDISLVMVPTSSPLGDELARDPGWGIWHCDATAVILQRGGSDRSSGISPDCPLH